MIKQIKKEVRFLQHMDEAYQLYAAVQNTTKINGDIAEVGCFQGGSTRLIALAKGTRPLYVFDTFDGLPEPTVRDDNPFFIKHRMTASYEEVYSYLHDIPNIFIYPGVFPGSGAAIQNKKFSFVHLDVDLYQGTKESLAFDPRMNRGAILICHDYVYQRGVREALDEFFLDKPEPVIELSSNQATFVKL